MDYIRLHQKPDINQNAAYSASVLLVVYDCNSHSTVGGNTTAATSFLTLHTKSIGQESMYHREWANTGLISVLADNQG